MTWKRICEKTDIAENSVTKFNINGVPILLVNYGSGFRAIPPVCPHMEEPLEESGIVVRCILTCSKHLWAWNLATLEMQGETERPLKTYEVKEEGGAIFANIQTELTYEFDSAEGADDDFFK
jgi:toluene monooxygenase system ferredoxin subunit